MKEEEGWERGRDIVLWPVKKGKIEVALPCLRVTSHCPLRPGARSDLPISLLTVCGPSTGQGHPLPIARLSSPALS